VTSRMLVGIPLWVLLAGLAGCGGDVALPTPSVVQPPPVVPPASPPAPGFLADHTLTAASLFGTVYESTAMGPMPIAGALVYCEPCGEITHTWATADTNGFYRFPGNLADGGGVWLRAGVFTPVSVRADGYYDPTNRDGQRYVLIVGDTRLDFELVRR
jgi:hypothetical protein